MSHINLLLNDVKLKNKLCKAAQIHISNNLSLQAYQDQFLNEYQYLLAANKKDVKPKKSKAASPLWAVMMMLSKLVSINVLQKMNTLSRMKFKLGEEVK